MKAHTTRALALKNVNTVLFSKSKSNVLVKREKIRETHKDIYKGIIYKNKVLEIKCSTISI